MHNVPKWSDNLAAFLQDLSSVFRQFGTSYLEGLTSLIDKLF